MIAEICLLNGMNLKLSLEGLAKKYLNVKSNKDYDLFNQYEVTLEVDELDEHSLTPFEVANLNQVDKSIRLGFVKLGKNNFTYEQIAYGSDDIIYPILIRQKQLEGHEMLGFKFCNPHNILFESEYTQVGADMELNGLPFNIEKWKELERKNHKTYNERLNKLNQYIINNYPKYCQLTLFGGNECVIDWSSPQQVIRFFRELGICPKEKSKQTKKMEWSVSSKALLPTIPYKDEYMWDAWLDIEDFDTLKLAYLLVRKSQMNITTYGNDFLKYVHPITGKLHPKYRLHLISSRTATTSPNLLAIPSSHRSAFTGEKTLIVNDYSSQIGSLVA